MSRELYSQPGEPTWAIDERVHRLEARVRRLEAIIAEFTGARPVPPDVPEPPDPPGQPPIRS